MHKILFHSNKAQIVLLTLYQNPHIYPTIIAKKTQITYSWVLKILKEFEHLGYITSHKASTMRTITLTCQGEIVAAPLREFYLLSKHPDLHTKVCG